jgi:Restriction endonuclease
MTVDATSKRPLTQLNREIEALEADVERLEAERKAITKDASRAKWRLRYLHAARSVRKPAATVEIWHTLVLIFGSGVVGVLLFIIVHLVFDSLPLAVLGLLIGGGGGAAMFASLLYRPPDALLPTAADEAGSHARLVDARLKEKIERMTETKQKLQQLVDERRDQIASGKLQKAALLQRPWKSMRDAEWEDFVVEVCRTLGAKVDRIGRAAEDANLIADFGPPRVAVLTQAADHNVSSATIQLALAARERHHCDSCAVIINRRFTGAAQDFAQRNGCTAIGTGEFPDFVMGKTAL